MPKGPINRYHVLRTGCLGASISISNTSISSSWWRHQMKTFSALLALCEGNPLVTVGFPSQRPVTRSFDIFFDLRPNKRLNKQLRRRWFETHSRPLWRHSIFLYNILCPTCENSRSFRRSSICFTRSSDRQFSREFAMDQNYYLSPFGKLHLKFLC